MPYTTAQLSDLECIRNVALRYCRGVDRLDEALMKSAYWPEATDDHGVYVGNAHTFVEHCMVSHLRWRSTNHCIFNHSIELDADGRHARGEIYNVTWLFHADAPVLDTWWGRYLDVYEKRGEEWRIIERVCVNEGTATAPIDAMAIDAARFRQGSFDRPSASRPPGP
ncbi:MAG: nuclear transport factor 2 family protein [Pseudomonadales bacterium]